MLVLLPIGESLETFTLQNTINFDFRQRMSLGEQG
jgi:hypothetical protein